MDREKFIKGLEELEGFLFKEYANIKAEESKIYYDRFKSLSDAIDMLKVQKIEEPHPWEHIWDAPDYTFKGRCRNCGFIHYFIQGHDAQYRFCPQCGEQKVI